MSGTENVAPNLETLEHPSGRGTKHQQKVVEHIKVVETPVEYQAFTEGSGTNYQTSGQPSGSSISEKSEQGSQYVGEKAQQGSQYVGEKAQQGRQYTGEKSQQMSESAREGANYLAEKAQQGRDYMGKKTQQMGESVKEGANYLGEKAQQATGYTGEKAQQGRDYAGEKAQQTGETAKQGANYVGEKAQQATSYTGEKAQQGREYLGEKAQQAGETAQQGASYLGEKAQQATSYTGEKAQQGREYLGEKAQQAGETAQQGASYLGEKTQQMGESLKQGTTQAAEQTGGVINRIKEYATQKWEETKESQTIGPYVQKVEETIFGTGATSKPAEHGVSVPSSETKPTIQKRHQVIEIFGESYSSHKKNLVAETKQSGIEIYSTPDESGGTIKHFLCGVNALKVVEGQQTFLNELQKKEFFFANIPKKSVHFEIKFVPKGSTFCWEFTVESLDINFSVKQRVKDEENRIINFTIADCQSFQGGDNVQGKWEAEEDSTVVLEWDNSYSMMLSKNIQCRLTLF